MAKKVKFTYPKWVDDYGKATHKAFVNMVPCSWGPIDFFDFLSYLDGTFISKVHKAVVVIKKKRISIDTIIKSFSCPSTVRGAILFLAYEYKDSKKKNKKQFKEVMEFLIKVLKNWNKKDIFCYGSNIIHSSSEINKIMKNTKWIKGNKESAREVGKLFNSASALIYGLYRDFFPQEGLDIYGPYPIERNKILLIKHFPKIKTVELWKDMKSLKYKEIKIFQVYKKVQFRCELIGMHSIYKGNLINNLTKFAVFIDNKIADVNKIKELSQYFAEIATKQSTAYDKLTKEQIKNLFLKWECYQFISFFRLAGIDWKPTKEMLKKVKNKKIGDRTEIKTYPSYKEFVNSKDFEVYWLKDLYK